MLLTILVPTSNRTPLLARCLDSVVRSIDRAAIHEQVEILVVDHGSHDAARDIVNYPLVHRECSSEAGFKLLGALHRRPYFFPWTTGLIRLANAAAARGVVKQGFLKEVHEATFENSYELSLEMKVQYVRQLILYCDTRESIQLPSLTDFEEFFGYFHEGNEPDWIDCCLFVSFLKLKPLGLQWRTSWTQSSCPADDLAAIRSELQIIIDRLVNHIPLSVVPQRSTARILRLKQVVKRVLGKSGSRWAGKVYRKRTSLAACLLPPL